MKAPNNLKYYALLGSIGLAGGLFIAWYNKKGFWAYMGYAILFSMIGSALGYAIDISIAVPDENYKLTRENLVPDDEGNLVDAVTGRYPKDAQGNDIIKKA